MYIEKFLAKNDKKSIVYFDNDTFCPLYNSEIHKYKLVTNMFLDEELYQEIYIRIVLKRAKLRAMNILKSYDKTEKQLRDKLHDDGYDGFTSDEVISYLKSYGYIDDYRIARNYYDYHCENDSHNAIRQKLMKKGIEKHIIDEVLSENCGMDENSIESVIIKKRLYLKCTDEQSTNKVIMTLMRKGYSYELSRRKLEELKNRTL